MQLVIISVVTDAAQLRQYSSAGTLPGKLGSPSSSRSSESMIAKVHLCTRDSHSTNQYKSVIVSNVGAVVIFVASNVFLLFL